MCAPDSMSVDAVSPTTSDATKSFLGKTIEICICSPDIDKSISRLSALGIEPWHKFTFDRSTCHSLTYRGSPASFELRVAFAEFGNMTYEIIQPVSGPTIFAEYLEKNGGVEGLHHVAFDCNNVRWEERLKSFEDRGFRCAQSGVWKGKNGEKGCHFAFFEALENESLGEESGEGKGRYCVETIWFEDGWEFPDS